MDIMLYILICFFFEGYGDHRDLHVLTHSFPTRRSSDLIFGGRHAGQEDRPARSRPPVLLRSLLGSACLEPGLQAVAGCSRRDLSAVPGAAQPLDRGWSERRRDGRAPDSGADTPDPDVKAAGVRPEGAPTAQPHRRTTG